MKRGLEKGLGEGGKNKRSWFRFCKLECATVIDQKGEYSSALA